MQFGILFMEVTKMSLEDLGVDPLEKPFTIAAACNFVLRRNFIETEPIAIIPLQGYGDLVVIILGTPYGGWVELIHFPAVLAPGHIIINLKMVGV